MKNKKTLRTIGIISIALFLVIFILVLMKRELFIDKLFAPFIASIRSNGLTSFFKLFTYLGDKYFIALLVFVIAVIMFIKRKRFSALLLCANLVDIVILNKVVKYIVRRPRPVDMLIEKDGYSFPSGHSMLTIGVYGLLIYMICKSKLNKNIKVISTILLSLVILIVGFSRLYLNVHYPSDIIGGYLLSFGYLMIFISFIDVFKNILKK